MDIGKSKVKQIGINKYETIFVLYENGNIYRGYYSSESKKHEWEKINLPE